MEAGGRYSLESTGPGLVGTSECGKTQGKLNPIRAKAVWGRQWTTRNVREWHQLCIQLILFKPGKTSLSNKWALCKWRNQQTGNDWFQWLHWWRTPQSDFSADLPSAAVDNCSPLLKTVSNSFGPLFFILISSQTGNNSFLHLHSYSESIYRW